MSNSVAYIGNPVIINSRIFCSDTVGIKENVLLQLHLMQKPSSLRVKCFSCSFISLLIVFTTKPHQTKEFITFGKLRATSYFYFCTNLPRKSMAQLTIVRASAGSGKTFRLTLEYLSHLYNNTDDFSHILAVTFTNKATEEMKSRIIRVLHELAMGRSSDYLQPLLIITNRSEKEIRLKSDIILKKILHNYSRFSVSTIDSFFQHIIRSFIREIGIQGGYRIEMDDDLILQKAIDNLFTRIEEDKALRNWLTEFTESKIEGSQSWNMKCSGLEEKFSKRGTNSSAKILVKSFMTKIFCRITGSNFSGSEILLSPSLPDMEKVELIQ